MFRNTTVKENGIQIRLAKIVGLAHFNFALIWFCTVCICPTNKILCLYEFTIYMPLYVLMFNLCLQKCA